MTREELCKECSRREGASPGELKALIAFFGVNLPRDYLDLLTYSNGIEGFLGQNYVSLFSADVVRLYWMPEFAPHYIFIGSDGAGEGFAYDTRDPSMPIVNVPFIGVDETPRLLGHSIHEFLERLNTKPLFD